MAFVLNSQQSNYLPTLLEMMALLRQALENYNMNEAALDAEINALAELSSLQNSSNEEDKALWDKVISPYNQLILSLSDLLASTGKLDRLAARKLRNTSKTLITSIKKALEAQLNLIAARNKAIANGDVASSIPSISALMKDPTLTFRNIDSKTLDLAAKQAGASILNSIAPSYAGTDASGQLTIYYQGIENPQQDSRVLLAVLNIIAQHGITAENGYSNQDIMNAALKVLQIVSDTARGGYTMKNNQNFESTSQRESRKRQLQVFDWQYTRDENGNITGYNPDYIEALRLQTEAKLKNALRETTLSDGTTVITNSSGSKIYTRDALGNLVDITKSSNTTNKLNKKGAVPAVTIKEGKVETTYKSTPEVGGEGSVDFEDLPEDVLEWVVKHIGEDVLPSSYTYIYDKSSILGNRSVTIIPNKKNEAYIKPSSSTTSTEQGGEQSGYKGPDWGQ